MDEEGGENGAQDRDRIEKAMCERVTLLTTNHPHARRPRVAVTEFGNAIDQRAHLLLDRAGHRRRVVNRVDHIRRDGDLRVKGHVTSGHKHAHPPLPPRTVLL
jgi:hypothetical protein